MSWQEKLAWFYLIVIVIASTLFFTQFQNTLMYHDAAVSTGRNILFVALLLTVLVGPVLFKEKHPGPVENNSHTTQKFTWQRYLFSPKAPIAIFIVLWLIFRYLTPDSFFESYRILIIPCLFGIYVSIHFLRFIFLKKQKETSLKNLDLSMTELYFYGKDLDERDIMILRKARHYSLLAFWTIFAFGLLGTAWWGKLQGVQLISIEIRLLPGLVVISMLIIALVSLTTTVIQYRIGK